MKLNENIPSSAFFLNENLSKTSSSLYLKEMMKKAKELNQLLRTVSQSLVFKEKQETEEFNFILNLGLALDLLSRFDELIE